MTSSEASFLAIIFGLGVFAVIVAIGWRSVQNRRILRLQGADGKETIIVAREDDQISSVVTSATEPPAAPAAEFGRSAAEGGPAVEAEADVPGGDRLSRMVSSTK